MSKGTLLKFFCLYVLKPVMLPCLPMTDKLYRNKPHRREPWFAYETPAEIARSSQKGCSKKRNRKATVLLSSCRGSSRAPPVGLKGKSWWLRGAGLRGGEGGGRDLCVVPPDKGPCPPQEGAEMQSKLPAPFLSLGGIWKCKALNTNCLNWTYVNLF